MKRAVFLLFFALAPVLVFGAGFARQSLFLSKASVTEGESVLIHAPVKNDAAAWSGEAVFSDDARPIGTVSVSLKAGEARVVSVSWTPETPGTHAISARLSKDGTVADTLSANFTVEAKPKAKEDAEETALGSAAAIQSGAVVKDWLGNISPVLANTLAPVISTVDPLRQSASNLIDGQLAAAKQKLPGNVLGSSTQASSTEPVSAATLWDSVWGVLWTVYYYLLTVLNFLIVNAALFYPILAFLFLFLLWKLYQRMSGRSYRY